MRCAAAAPIPPFAICWLTTPWSTPDTVPGRVLSPTLRGLEAVDDADAVRRIYGSEPTWDDLGILNEAFVPHYQSPGHPETATIGLVAARYWA